MRALIPFLLRKGVLRGGMAVFAPPFGGGTVIAGPSPAGLTNLGYSPTPLMQPPPTSLDKAASLSWVLQIAAVANSVQQGKINATLEVTLTANANSTTITDARISATSAITFMPLTASAATEYAGGSVYISNQTAESAVIAHTNDAATDRRFRLVVLA